MRLKLLWPSRVGTRNDATAPRDQRAFTTARAMADDAIDDTFYTALEERTRAYDEALDRMRPAASFRTLKVCSWNLQLLRGIFRGQGGTRADMLARVERIAANVLRVVESSAVDVIAFQEVWDDACRKRLCALLYPAFPFIHAPKAKCGLMICSKLSHVCNHFARLKGATGIEARVFEKGVCSSILRLDGNRVCLVMNCHLQSNYWANGRSAREEQMREMRQALHRAVRECAGNGYVIERCILCGDLNVDAGSAEYDVMMFSTFPGAIDLMIPPSSNGDDESFRLTFPVARWRHYIVPCGRTSRYIDETPRTRIDYVLDLTPMVKAGVPPRHAHVDSGYVHETMCRDVSGQALSDHFPVVAFSSLYAFNDRDYSL